MHSSQAIGIHRIFGRGEMVLFEIIFLSLLIGVIYVNRLDLYFYHFLWSGEIPCRYFFRFHTGVFILQNAMTRGWDENENLVKWEKK